MPTQSEGNNNNIYGGKQQIANNVGSQNQIFMGDEFAKTILERDKHPITVAVTGAGVEATLGIPTSSSLIPCIADYLATDEGKAVDAALRKAIGSVRFSFDKFVEKAIGDLAKDLDRELATICRNVSHELQHNTALDDSQRKMGQLVVRLFHKIIEVKANANIDAETEQLISEVLGTAVNDDTIIDFSRLSYTETFKAVIIEILQQSMHDSNNPILRHVYRNILDIEQLLSRYFCGFYEGKDGYIRTYMYIAWMLWAYLVRQEQAIATGEATAAPGQDVYAQMQDKELSSSRSATPRSPSAPRPTPSTSTDPSWSMSTWRTRTRCPLATFAHSMLSTSSNIGWLTRSASAHPAKPTVRCPSRRFCRP